MCQLHYPFVSQVSSIGLWSIPARSTVLAKWTLHIVSHGHTVLGKWTLNFVIHGNTVLGNMHY